MRSTNAGRVGAAVLDMAAVWGRKTLAEEWKVFRRFADCAGVGSVGALFGGPEVGFDRDVCERLGLCEWSWGFLLEGFLDELAIFSTDESSRGFIDVDASLNGHECV